MPTYLTPGVYIEEIPSGVKPIEGVATSVAAFVGYTTKGPVGTAVSISGFDDYVRQFGAIRDLGSQPQGDPMGFSLAAFFQNGGTRAYVVRLAEDDSPDDPLDEALGYIRSPVEPTDVLEFEAVNAGTWANGLVARVVAKAADPSLYTVTIGRLDDRGELVVLETFDNVSLDPGSPRFVEAVVNGVSENLNVTVMPESEVAAFPDGYLSTLTGTSTSGDLSGADLDFTGLPVGDRELDITLDTVGFTITVPDQDFTDDLAGLAAEIQSLVRSGASAERRTGFTAEVDGDTLVLTSGTRGLTSSAEVDPAVGLAGTLLLGGDESDGADSLDALLDGNEALLVDGADGVPAGDQAYTDIFTDFVKVRDITMLCLPGTSWDTEGQPVIQAAVAHAESTGNRMVLIDPEPSEELETEADVLGLGLPTSTYSVLYYPWLEVTNPFFDAEDNPGVPRTVLVPPSGYAAGMWSRIDGRRGVWKAPAGVETGLLGLSGPEFTVEDAEQSQLNPLGVNALRSRPGFGTVIWGSRTLSTRANPEWRYVPVRRTAIFIEQSIYNGIQWAVFEPNDHRLWASLRLNIESFMDGLFRSGAFQGEKASDAYFVRCGLGDTMTQDDIDRGQVIAIVGFAPLKPAEFVIVRIQQKVAQQ